LFFHLCVQPCVLARPSSARGCSVGAVPAVPARVRSCSEGADPVIPSAQLLRVGRSRHLGLSGQPAPRRQSIFSLLAKTHTPWTMARRIRFAHGGGVLRECRCPDRFRSAGFVLSAPSTDASHSRFINDMTSTIIVRIICGCGPACPRADGFAPRVLAAGAATVALVEDAPARHPNNCLA